MFDLRLRAYDEETGKIYDVVNIDLFGAIRFVSLLDIYSQQAVDGEAPIKKVQITSKIKILRYTGFTDVEGRDIYEGDKVRDKKNNEFIIIYNEDLGSFTLGDSFLVNHLNIMSINDKELLLIHT